ncbi:SDR family NAD(P)-dependent oxidoreductase [Paenibacillus ginsengarvi]|uniref:SDR family NAD(P)-dependent oxidoreductase n=1 Tax=Paenibacillus ginsengarvi TaxID=400777 RepID=A0A3B0B660_9BACL|nr:SDR family NAD(P)-dependent oxidoreductase [Paenibacillus ginsengarvi]RKN66047.1 SDR family NAD(P)-dependent oxidoreductase [Paenibacillus ginsengarvi]
MNYTVITGASSGIGYETALAFAARGKNLIVTARRTKELEKLRDKVAASYPNLDVVIRAADLSVAATVYELYESVREYRIETWINNAGSGSFATVGEQDLDRVTGMLHLNIEALTILSTLYARDYADVEGTQLINISSGGGYQIVGNSVAYCASKFYVSAFTEGLAQELKERGAAMQAKVLAPASTATEFIKSALNLDEFRYEGVVPRYHTAEQMAGFLLELYDSDKIVGIVNGATYDFELRDPIYPYVGRRR